MLLTQKRKRKKLENSVASLLENAASDKNQVAEEIKEIKSSVALVKTGLGAQKGIKNIPGLDECDDLLFC